MLRGEIPPTAGLPLRLTDLLPGRPALAARVAAQLGTPPLIATCSGTAALLLALRVLGARAPNRRVVVAPAYTCPLVAIAVRQAGLQLRLCDLADGTPDMNPAALADACGEDTLAVLPTHLAGRVTDVATAVVAARRVGAVVIEDAAQALGARDHGASVGLRGDVAFFSLAAGKGLSIYEGGLLFARDPALHEALRVASERGVPWHLGWELQRCAELLGLALLYRPLGLRLAYGRPLRAALRRGDPVAAAADRFPDTVPFHRVGAWRLAVGAHAARRLPAFLAALRAQARRRLAALRAIDGLDVFDDPPGTEGSWPFLLLRLPDTRSRDTALAELWGAGLGVGRLFVHALPDYNYLAGQVPAEPMPQARDFAARTLTISNSPWLDDAAFERICQVLERSLR